MCVTRALLLPLCTLFHNQNHKVQKDVQMQPVVALRHPHSAARTVYIHTQRCFQGTFSNIGKGKWVFGVCVHSLIWTVCKVERKRADAKIKGQCLLKLLQAFYFVILMWHFAVDPSIRTISGCHLSAMFCGLSKHRCEDDKRDSAVFHSPSLLSGFFWFRPYAEPAVIS